MAFLDNSGDIILDAVLTDTGRYRMARGDFKITKFALGDDEVDYALFNRNHPSGSSYYDLEVLKTPVLEAFTNNTSLMKSKLLTISRTDILHLPILKLSDGGYANAHYKQTRMNEDLNMYVVTVDKNTEKAGYCQYKKNRAPFTAEHIRAEPCDDNRDDGRSKCPGSGKISVGPPLFVPGKPVGNCAHSRHIMVPLPKGKTDAKNNKLPE